MAATAPTAKNSGARKSAARKKPFTHEQSVEQMRALLEAKQERVRQGPSWPAANAHTGHIDGAEAGVRDETQDPVLVHTAPESNFGVVGMHGRGNQGKRGQS